MFLTSSLLQYSTEGKVKEPNLAAEVGQGLFGMAKSYAQKDMGGVLKGAMGLFKTATGNTQKAEEYSKKTRTSPADVVSFCSINLRFLCVAYGVSRSRGVDVKTPRRALIRSKRVVRRVP